MLKAYCVRESSQNTVSLNESNSHLPIVTLTCDVLIDSPDDEDYGVIVRHTYQQCARLKNSEVLADLCSSLSHLPDSQRFDTEQLIHAFPSLFHDVPTRTTIL